MQVFAVFEISHPEEVQSLATKHFQGSHYVLSPSTIFVATDTQTTQGLGELLGFKEEGHLGVVVPVTFYWGRHNVDLWDWLSGKLAVSG